MDQKILKQYRWILKEIEYLENEKRLLLDHYLSRGTWDGMPHSCGEYHDSTASIVVKRQRLQELIDEKLDELIECRREIEQAWRGLSPDDRMIMRWHYLDGKSWGAIAAKMSYSYRWILERHRRILQALK